MTPTNNPDEKGSAGQLPPPAEASTSPIVPKTVEVVGDSASPSATFFQTNITLFEQAFPGNDQLETLKRLGLLDRAIDMWDRERRHTQEMEKRRADATDKEIQHRAEDKAQNYDLAKRALRLDWMIALGALLIIIVGLIGGFHLISSGKSKEGFGTIITALLVPLASLLVSRLPKKNADEPRSSQKSRS